MKLYINITTSPETNYVDGKTVYLNPNDAYISPQTINVQLTDYTYTGSLQPLYKMISDWVKNSMFEAIDIEAARKRTELAKKLKHEQDKKNSKT